MAFALLVRRYNLLCSLCPLRSFVFDGCFLMAAIEWPLFFLYDVVAYYTPCARCASYVRCTSCVRRTPHVCSSPYIRYTPCCSQFRVVASFVLFVSVALSITLLVWRCGPIIFWWPCFPMVVGCVLCVGCNFCCSSCATWWSNNIVAYYALHICCAPCVRCTIIFSSFICVAVQGGHSNKAVVPSSCHSTKAVALPKRSPHQVKAFSYGSSRIHLRCFTKAVTPTRGLLHERVCSTQAITPPSKRFLNYQGNCSNELIIWSLHQGSCSTERILFPMLLLRRSLQQGTNLITSPRRLLAQP